MRALLLVDHGSRRQSANENLAKAADVVRERAPGLLVHVAHMELAEPTIDAGFEACKRDGADEVIVFPWFLAEGRHVREDIPQLSAEAATKHGLRHRVAAPFGIDVLLAELALRRCGIEVDS